MRGNCSQSVRPRPQSTPSLLFVRGRALRAVRSLNPIILAQRNALHRRPQFGPCSARRRPLLANLSNYPLRWRLGDFSLTCNATNNPIKQSSLKITDLRLPRWCSFSSPWLYSKDSKECRPVAGGFRSRRTGRSSDLCWRRAGNFERSVTGRPCATTFTYLLHTVAL